MSFYPAILSPVDSSGVFHVSVPDFQADGSGPTEIAAIQDAIETTNRYIIGLGMGGGPIPNPTPVDQIHPPAGGIVIGVDVNA